VTTLPALTVPINATYCRLGLQEKEEGGGGAPAVDGEDDRLEHGADLPGPLPVLLRPGE
jgi:hypothetical protein